MNTQDPNPKTLIADKIRETWASIERLEMAVNKTALEASVGREANWADIATLNHVIQGVNELTAFLNIEDYGNQN